MLLLVPTMQKCFGLVITYIYIYIYIIYISCIIIISFIDYFSMIAMHVFTSDLSDKTGFLSSCVCIALWKSHLGTNVTHGENTTQKVHKECCVLFWKNLGSNIQQNSNCTATTTHLTPHLRKMNKTCWALSVEVRMNALVTFSYGRVHIDALVLAVLLGLA